MKLENLYKIEELPSAEGSSRIFEAIINPQSDIFKGHFPGAPVLPGVCTLYMLKDCLSIALNSDVTISEISQCKFTGMVDPVAEQRLEFQTEIKEESEKAGKVTATVKMGETGRVIMKFRGGYRIG